MRRELLALALCAGPVAIFLAETWEVRAPLDDAYISYRYARNLVEGHGLVYNPGSYVEGYTNLLWTLLVAGGLALGQEARALGHALGVLFGAATLLVAFAFARTALPRSRAWGAAAAPAVLAASGSLPRWSTSGMETTLFAAATTGAFAAMAAGRRGVATAALVAAALTRPDGVLAAAVLYGFDLVRERGRGGRVWAGPLVFAAALGGVTAFRLLYYGAPLPNTFYAKVGTVPFDVGLRHVLAFLAAGNAFLLLPAAVAVWREPRLRPAGAWIAGVLAYVLWVGGDAFGHYRFLLPALPALAALAAVGAERAHRLHPAAGLAGAACVALACVWHVFRGVPPPLGAALALAALVWAAFLRFGRGRVAFGAAAAAAALAVAYVAADPGGRVRAAATALAESPRSRELREVQRLDRFFEALGRRQARVLRRREPPPELVATGGIGAIGYYARVPILDIYGLVDPTVARSGANGGGGIAIPGHQRSDADYVLFREPDYILIPERDTRPRTQANLDLWRHPALSRHYVWDEELEGYRRVSPAPREGRDPSSGDARSTAR